MLGLIITFLFFALPAGTAVVLWKKYGGNDIRFKIGLNLSFLLDGVVIFFWGLYAQSKGIAFYGLFGIAPISGNQYMGIGLVFGLFALKAMWKLKVKSVGENNL